MTRIDQKFSKFGLSERWILIHFRRWDVPMKHLEMFIGEHRLDPRVVNPKRAIGSNGSKVRQVASGTQVENSSKVLAINLRESAGRESSWWCEATVAVDSYGDPLVIGDNHSYGLYKCVNHRVIHGKTFDWAMFNSYFDIARG